MRRLAGLLGALLITAPIAYAQVGPSVNGGFGVRSIGAITAGHTATWAAQNILQDGGSAPAVGTVTSVGLALPTLFTVTGSPITSNGTLTGSLTSQAANTVFSGPANGAAAAPIFRALVSADVPPINLTSSGQGGVTTPMLSGTTASLGGGALLAGGCAGTTVAVTNAATNMVVIATPATYPGDGVWWHGYVSSANSVTVKVCAAVAATPAATAYNVRVIQ